VMYAWIFASVGCPAIDRVVPVPLPTAPALPEATDVLRASGAGDAPGRRPPRSPLIGRLPSLEGRARAASSSSLPELSARPRGWCVIREKKLLRRPVHQGSGRPVAWAAAFAIGVAS